MYPVLDWSEDYLLVSTFDGGCLLFKTNNPADSTPITIKSKPTDKVVDDEAKGLVLHAKFSHSGKHLMICNDYKQLLLYSLKMIAESESSLEWTLVSSRVSAKKGVKLEFLKDDGCALMADKFGDITSYSVLEPEKEGETILGHLSTLLDCTFVLDGKYLVTADRDEKIRVSCYPNTYNIQAFCLGHTKYVTSVAAAENWLVSGSGDGTVKLWNPLTGEMLSEIVCSEGSRVVQQLLYIPEHKCVVCLVAGSTKLLFISIDNGADKPALKQKVREQELPAPALAMCSSAESIVVLLNSDSQPLLLLNSNCDATSNNSDSNVSIAAICREISTKWSTFAGAYAFQSDFFVNLTKMNIDNVGEELVRKGKRVNMLTSTENKDAKMVKV